MDDHDPIEDDAQMDAGVMDDCIIHGERIGIADAMQRDSRFICENVLFGGRLMAGNEGEVFHVCAPVTVSELDTVYIITWIVDFASVIFINFEDVRSL